MIVLLRIFLMASVIANALQSLSASREIERLEGELEEGATGYITHDVMLLLSELGEARSKRDTGKIAALTWLILWAMFW